jgi:hypothetical protein
MRSFNLAVLSVVFLMVADSAMATRLRTTRLQSYENDLAECWVTNLGTKPLTILSVKVVDDRARDITADDHCDLEYAHSLPPGASCLYTGSDVLDGFRCEVEFKGFARDVRLAADLFGFVSPVVRVVVEGH